MPDLNWEYEPMRREIYDMLHFWIDLGVDGDLKFYLDGHEEIIMYTRACTRQTLLIVANYSGKTVKFDIPEEIKAKVWSRKLTNKKDTAPSLDGTRDLRPWEIEIYELAK